MMGAVSRFAHEAASRGSDTAATTRARPSTTPARSSSPSTPPPPNAPPPTPKPSPASPEGGDSGRARSAASRSVATVSRRANASAHCAQSAWNAPEACLNASGAWSAARRYAAHLMATPPSSPRPATWPSQGAYAPMTRAAAATTSGCDANTALFGAGFEPGDASPMRLSVCRRNISVPSRSRVSDSVSRSRSAARVRTTSRFAALDAARAKNNALSACCQLAMVSSWLKTNPKYPPPFSAIPHIPKQLSRTSTKICSRKR
mmetsp:Transcript_3822/g.16221  ORF Transcript_3822/g.16221 Transcript_3822/m.16221 type:complete len:261 (+) Transcript_3822:1168-1950(+)